MPRHEEEMPENGPKKTTAHSDSQSGIGSGQKKSLGKSSNDAVMRALAEVEKTLGRLKQVRAEHAESEARFREQLESQNTQIETLLAQRDEAQFQQELLTAQLEELKTSHAQTTKAEHALAHAQAQTQSAQEDATRFKAKVHDQQLELDQLRHSLETIEQCAQEWSESRDESDTKIAQLEEQLGIAQTTITDLTSQNDPSGDAGDNQTAVQRDEALQTLASVRAESAHELASKQVQIDSLQTELAQYTQKLDLAAERLLEMQALLDSHDSTTDTPLSETGIPSPMLLRQKRLKHCRQLIHARSRKLKQLDESLSLRITQCDELLTRRRKLVEARQIIEKTHRKVVTGKAKSGAAAALFFAISLLIVLSAASWMITKQFVPAIYAASATIEADFGDATAQPQNVQAWQDFHEQLLLDPQLMEHVALQMNKRGFEELDTPTAVKTMLQSNLTTNSGLPGMLHLELQGSGKEHTQRMLDTYVTTLVAESNAMRQRRTESSQTIVSQQATSGAEPISDPRPRNALLGIAGAWLLAVLMWCGIWRKMVKSKDAFDNATQIDYLLEDAQWVDPIQKIMEAKIEGTGSAPHKQSETAPDTTQSDAA